MTTPRVRTSTPPQQDEAGLVVLDEWETGGRRYSLTVHRGADVGNVRRHRERTGEPVDVATVDYADGVTVWWDEEHQRRGEHWLGGQEKHIERLVRLWLKRGRQ